MKVIVQLNKWDFFVIFIFNNKYDQNENINQLIIGWNFDLVTRYEMSQLQWYSNKICFVKIDIYAWKY